MVDDLYGLGAVGVVGNGIDDAGMAIGVAIQADDVTRLDVRNRTLGLLGQIYGRVCEHLVAVAEPGGSDPALRQIQSIDELNALPLFSRKYVLSRWRVDVTIARAVCRAVTIGEDIDPRAIKPAGR